MARGYIYKIDTDIDDTDSTISEQDFYESHSGKECEYVTDYTDTDPVDCLCNDLRRHGLTVKTEPNIKNVYAVIRPTDEKRLNNFKTDYFRSRYLELKESLDKISLEEFAANTGTAFGLSNLAEDRCGDMVYLNGSCYILDDFIRDMFPDTEYYIQEKTVLMG